MSTQPNVEKLIRQTKRYEFLDGLRDVQLAIVVLAIGVLIWLVFDRMDTWLRVFVDLRRTLGGWAGWVVIIVMLMIPALLALGALPVMRQIRQRWLWRDSGMVRSKRWMMPGGVTLVSAGIGLIGLVAGVWLQMRSVSGDFILLRMLIVASGWSLAYTLVATGRLFDLRRYVAAGVIGGVLSTLLLWPALTVGQTGLLWGVLWCVVLIASGSGPLRRTAHKVQEAEPNG